MVVLSQSAVEAHPIYGGFAGMRQILNCDDINIGTMEHLSDVVIEGQLKADYMAAQFEFAQSQPHTFYIKGTTHLSGPPTVYSLTNDDSAKELMAFTQVENSHGIVKVEVKYSDKECTNELELMQMDIPLQSGCGTLSPQWFVKCDMVDAGQQK